MLVFTFIFSATAQVRAVISSTPSNRTLGRCHGNIFNRKRPKLKSVHRLFSEKTECVNFVYILSDLFNVLKMAAIVDMIRDLDNGDLNPEGGITFLTSIEDQLRLASATSTTEMALVN